MAKRLLAAMLLVLGSALAGPARADWPDRPVRFVVHVAAGGGVDLMARILADRLNMQLPQRVIVENMGGGGGAIAARAVAKAQPDGYTFLFAGPGHAAVPFMHKHPPYDPLKEFVSVSLVTQFPLVVVVNPKLAATSMAELVTLLKAEPDRHTFGSSGVGGSSHIPAEMLMSMAGVRMLHVPFRGGSESSAALVGGHIDLIIDGLAPQLGNIAEGRVRVLGVTTRERSPFLPDAPAVAESLPGYAYPMWVALFAPAATPKAIVDRLAAQVGTAVKDPATRARYEQIQVTAVGSTPGELDAFFREQLEYNERIITKAGIQLPN